MASFAALLGLGLVQVKEVMVQQSLQDEYNDLFSSEDETEEEYLSTFIDYYCFKCKRQFKSKTTFNRHEKFFHKLKRAKPKRRSSLKSIFEIARSIHKRRAEYKIEQY